MVGRIWRNFSFRFGQFFSHDLYFYGFLILAVIFLSQIPILLRLLHTPSGYYYPLLDKITFADYFYPALIKHGMGKEWLAIFPYTAVPHQGSLIQILFVFLGKLSLISGIGPAEMYALFRVVGGLVFTLSVVLLFRVILKPYQARWAFLFFLFAQPLVVPSDSFFTRDFAVWKWLWHYGEATRRLGMMPPHYTLGKALTILSLIFLILYFQKRKMPFFLISGVFIFAAGIIYPPPVFIFIVSLVLSTAIYILAKKIDFSVLKSSKTMALIVIILCSLLPLFVLQAELAKGYPWDMWQKVELAWNDPKENFGWKYLQMLGLLTFLIPFSLPKIFDFKRMKFFHLFIFFWFISSFLLFPFTTVLKLSKFRLIEAAQIVPMSILSWWGFTALLQFIKKVKSQAWARQFEKVFLVLLVAYFLIVTGRATYNFTLFLWEPWRNVYIHPDEKAALSYLDKYAAPGSIVLADVYPSNFIPAFAKVQTIIGFSDDPYEKESDYQYEFSRINAILKQELSEKEAREYLLGRRVGYIYDDVFDKSGKAFYPQLVEEVYQNPWFRIYKVKEGLK